MSFSNTGSVDLESVLSVRRRTLAAIGEKEVPRSQPRYTDTVYLKREESSNSILSTNSKIFILGELQYLYSIFERYTSNIIIYEDSIEPNPHSPISGNRPSFSTTFEENEDDTDAPPMISTVRKPSAFLPRGSTSPQASSSPLQVPDSSPQTPDSPTRRRASNPLGRPQVIGATNEFAALSLEGKRYGSIELPHMHVIEILEILFRSGLELVDVSSDYDKENVLHQNFCFSKTRSTAPKLGQFVPRSSSIAGI